MEFEWDPDKAEINVRKHGISFAEAGTVLETALPLRSLIQITLRLKTGTLQLGGRTVEDC